MMVSQSGSGLDYTRVVTLNQSAAFLIESVQGKEFSAEGWVDLLVEKYGISRLEADRDVQTLVNALKQHDLVET